MSDAYRDDHEAALARIDALEDELSRERAGDFAQEQRIAQLEAQLARAKEQVRQAEDAGFRLDKPRAEKPSAERAPVSTRARHSAVPVEIENPAPRRGGDRNVAIFVSVLLVAIVAVGLVLIATTHTPQPAPSSPAGQTPSR